MRLQNRPVIIGISQLNVKNCDILHAPSQCDRRWLLPPAASTTKLHTGSAGFKRFIVSKMPSVTTTVETVDLNSILYVLLFRFQRWLSGDLTGFNPTGRSSPVVGGNYPIFTLSNAMQLARCIYSIPLILLSQKFALILSPWLRNRCGSSHSQDKKCNWQLSIIINYQFFLQLSQFFPVSF